MPLAIPIRAFLPAVFTLLAGTAAAQTATFSPFPTNLPDPRGHAAIAPADYDGDGDVDLLAIRKANTWVDPMMRPVLYRNDGVDGAGALQLTEAPFPAPPYAAPVTTMDPTGEALSWSDYDSDGDVDALVATPYGTTLYRNDGGTFTSAATLPPYEETHVTAFDARSVTWTDYDNDGDVDLLLPAFYEAPPPVPGEPIRLDSMRLEVYANDGGALTATASSFPYFRGALQATPGDTDGDGDTDLLYHDVSSLCPHAEERCVMRYSNDGGAFAPDSALTFPPFLFGSASDLGDFDADGDLDILLVAAFEEGFGTESAAVVYRNDDSTFVPLTLDLQPSGNRELGGVLAASWADYDSDGDLDAVVAGRAMPGQDDFSFVFANAAGTLTQAAELPAVHLFGTVVWADLDADGDLDYITSGHARTAGPGSPQDFVTWVYRNDAPAANAAPTPPAGLTADAAADGTVSLAWAPSSDDHTAAPALTYNLWVRPATPGSDIVSPLARPGGGRLVTAPGNVSQNTAWTLRDLPAGTYTWTVQAVDNAFNGGPFAAEGQFTVGAVTSAGPSATPGALALQGVVPNPATGGAAVAFSLPAAAEVAAVVFDALGRAVLTVPAQPVEAGADRRLGLDVSALPAGTYLVRLEVRRGDAVEHRAARLTVAR